MSENEGQDPRDEFRAAIEKLQTEYGESEGMLSSWVLVVAETSINQDGSTSTFLTVMEDRHQAIHVTAGLLKYATTRNESRIRSMDNNDD